MTAASGMPKLEAGPQKSAGTNHACQRNGLESSCGEFREWDGIGISAMERLEARLRVAQYPARLRCGCAAWFGKVRAKGGVTKRTGRAEIIQRLVGADFGVDSLNCGGHCGRRKRCERRKAAKTKGSGEGEVVRGRSGVGSFQQDDFNQRRSSEGRVLSQCSGPLQPCGKWELVTCPAFYSF